MKKVLFLGLVFGALALTSCKKEGLNKSDSLNQKKEAHEVLYKKSIKVFSISEKDKYLKMRISTTDSTYLNRLSEYYSKLEVDFKKADKTNIENVKLDNESSIFSDSLTYSVSFDWSNYSFDNKDSKNKTLKKLVFVNPNSTKSLSEIPTIPGAANAISSSTGFAFAFIFDQTEYFDLGCFCNKHDANWKIARNQDGSSEICTSSLSIFSVVTINPTYGSPSYEINPDDLNNVSGSITNNIKSITGSVIPWNAGLNHHAKASMSIYFWI